MGRWLKYILLSVLAAAFSVTALTGPVFATPANPDNPANPPAVVTEPGDEEEETTPEEMPTCYDQVGGLGWLICPGTGFLANVIDGAYEVLENLLQVNPLPTDKDAPMHVVWDYMRGITNIIFVIFFLVVIYSQITGFGISNYGIKRVLPRLIVAAILINLSYILCTLAVDVSNILGQGFRSVFQHIQDQAIANGSINEIASTTSTAGIVATLLGIGTIGTVAALTFSGGVTGLIWLLIPIVLSGAIAIISAVVTMAARQALIFLLVMVSPLAFVAYLLPNTEKWFTKWYQMFFRMIFFYPLFSILYGASQLAGFVTITSATNWLGVVLGIAIQVLPLFMSIPLMRMSGTILGGVSGFIYRAANPARAAVGRRATEGRTLARQRQLASTSNIPHNRLARWLEQRRVNRQFDTTETAMTNAQSYMAGAYASLERRDRDGNRKRLTGRGVRYNAMLARRMQAANIRSDIETDFDEGFNDNAAATAIPVLRQYHNAQIRRTNENFRDAIIDDHVAGARRRSVTRQNALNKADRIREEANDVNSRVHQQITSAFRLNNNPAEGTEEALAVKRAVNDVLAEAITTKRKADNDLKNNYLELYDDMPAGPGPMRQLEEAFSTKDYNSASAAMLIMAKRGDHGDLIRTMVNHSNEIANDFAMQKNLADTGLSLKKENIYMWAWAKANMIRRGMNGSGMEVAPYIDMQTFLSGQPAQGDNPQLTDSLKKATLKQIFSDLNSWSALASQDRTVFKEMQKLIEDGTIPMGTNADGGEAYPLLFPEKYFRSAATSGLMDGEQLGMLNSVLTGGFKLGAENQSEFFNTHHEAIHNQLMSYLNNMVANQLVTSKTSTLMSINGALLAINPDDYIVRIVDGKEMHVSREMFDAFTREREALSKPSAINHVNSMNKAVREMLDIESGPRNNP